MSSLCIYKATRYDGIGAVLWIGAMVSIGWGFGQMGAALDPRWAAYIGLAMLVLCAIMLAVVGKRLRARLLPLAEKILAERMARKNNCKNIARGLDLRVTLSFNIAL